MLKGANAMDSNGNVGVIMVSPVGGTMGQFYMALKARAGDDLSVGLEKMIRQCRWRPSTRDDGDGRGDRSPRRDGLRVRRVVFTEIDAIENLFGIDACTSPPAAGARRGCVTLIVEGPDARLASA